MPLLKKRSFEKASPPEFLRDDEEVFYCEVTNEIFRNYEEFAERMLLCTSMVWTCALTGKSNLTYEEALESEENAKKSIKEFPVELRIPVLYVGSKTKRTGFGEMADDVFLYCKDRYFIGEKVETSFTGNKWVDSHVLQVIAPSADEIKKSQKNGSTEKHPAASLYKYEIEHLDAEDEDISEIMIVDHNQIRRKKGLFNREKCKLFLKQCVEQDAKGHWTIKPSSVKEYALGNLTFDHIFAGPDPDFDSSRKFAKADDAKKSKSTVANGSGGGKKSRQETLAKYLTKTAAAGNGGVLKKMNGDVKTTNETKSSKTSEKNNHLMEMMEKRKEEFEKMKLQKQEEKLAEREKQKRATVEIAVQLKEWQKQKEDLELEDQQVPPHCPVIKSKIPNELLGEVLMLMEFIKSFEKLLKCKNFFQTGVTFDIMERALLEQEVAGPLTDLIQMLLTALFREHEDENSEYSMQTAKGSFLKTIDINNMSLEEASRFATIASKWPRDRQGMSLRNLPLYSLTVTEVLRLHLLSSGAKLLEAGERGRFAQRGGYSCTDDPGLYLRVHKPHILRALGLKNVVQLNVKDKVAILTCLMDQLLTYADIRDTIEDRIEKNRQLKLELRNAQASERKRQNEYSGAKWHLKRDAKVNDKNPQETDKAMKELDAAEEKRKAQSERQIDSYKKSAYDHEIHLGLDRAYRRYYKLESVPGLFIEATNDDHGPCLAEPVKQVPELVGAEKTAITKYLRGRWNKTNNSNKENSPAKSPAKKLNGDATAPEAVDAAHASAKLLMCSGDEKTCVVHSTERADVEWRFVSHVDTFESIVSALNKRGVRESELMQTLQNDREALTKFIRQTPVQSLNPELDIGKEEEAARPRVATRGKKNYMDANLGFPSGTAVDEILHNTLTDNILELEEKIYSGGLGQLHIKDRETWRDCLLNKRYKNLNREIVRTAHVKNDEEMKVDEEEEEEEEEEEASTEIKCKYGNYDPGTFLGRSKSKDDGCDEGDEGCGAQHGDMKLAVECLAIALAQIAHAVEPKFLLKPLGDSTNRKLATCHPSTKQLANWEHSLLSSTSFSQIFLHYSTLDSCVMWNRSTLRAKCRLCRGQSDSENMLLCDSCNLGHHLYCLKPKLTSIPKGDWFCDTCDKERRKAWGSEVIPKKKRRIFKEEEQEEEEVVPEESDQEEEEEDDDEEEGKESDDEESEEEEEQSDDEDESFVKVEVCATCNSGGILITCYNCSTAYHKECVDPPLRRAKANWTCSDCNQTTKDDKISAENQNNNGKSSRSRRGGRGSKKHGETAAASSDSDDYPLSHHAAGNVNNERRSAAKARHNIYNFVKSLRRISSSGNDSDSEGSPSHNNSQRKRSHRRESGRDDLPLHNAALQDLLTEVMKFPDAWPFLRPVQKNEVPDYHEVITHPMDFGTIKYKLNMGKYSTDAQLMFDAALVFKNCNTYNEMDSEIYRCGESVLELFRSRCTELGLKIPSNSEAETETDKKRRKK